MQASFSILKPKRQTEQVHVNDNSKLNASFVHETQDIHKEENVEIMLQLTPPIYNHIYIYAYIEQQMICSRNGLLNHECAPMGMQAAIKDQATQHYSG